MEIKNQTRSENFNLNLILPSNIHIHMTVLAILLFMCFVKEQCLPIYFSLVSTSLHQYYLWTSCWCIGLLCLQDWCFLYGLHYWMGK